MSFLEFLFVVFAVFGIMGGWGWWYDHLMGAARNNATPADEERETP